jgi:antitoxin ParD1/3/4
MRTTQSLSITLPLEMAHMVKAKVASGEYATESEVIRDGLRVLATRDAVVEKWFREDGVSTYDAVMADPDKTVSADQVFDELRTRHAERMAKLGKWRPFVSRPSTIG